MRKRKINESLEIIIDSDKNLIYEIKGNDKINVDLIFKNNISSSIVFYVNKSDVLFNVNIEDDSKIDFKIIYEENSNSEFNFDIKGSVKLYTLLLSNKIETKYNFDLNKENSYLKMQNAVYLNNNESNYDIKVNHNINSSNALILSNAVLNNEALLKMNIENNVYDKVSNVDTYQKTKVLALSDDAKAHINPILNVDFYDIKGGHALSFMNIKNYDFDYFLKRGIKKENAVKLVVKAFLSDQSDIEEIIESWIVNEKLS